MKKIKITAIITVLAMLLVGLCGCTTFDNFKAAFIDKSDKQEVKIQIGVLEPVTGADSKAAEDEIRGIQLANRVHPNVHGKIISLVFSDDKSDIDATETAAKTLIEKKPLLILGSYGSVYSLAASPYIREAKIPAIAITNTNPLVTRNNEYYFRVCYVDSNQGDLLARYVLDSKKEKKAGVLIPSKDDAALAEATAFTDRIKSETGNEDAISYYEEFTTGQKDFSKELGKLERSGVKSVILPGDYTDAADIINQASEMKLDVQFLGDTTWGQQEFKNLLAEGTKEENMAFVQFFAADSGADGEAITAERDRFLKAYYKEYGRDSEPTDAMALGYDAYFVAIDAIDKAGDDISSEAVLQVLADPHYYFEGASGAINFSSIGDPIKTAYISTWKGNGMVTVYTVEAQK
ncbi:MAG: ABC transporter substrate-binding protein [Clostridia bacterium]|nr:ABC transporter substrate-binding protein [Clostridia bacterium]